MGAASRSAPAGWARRCRRGSPAPGRVGGRGPPRRTGGGSGGRPPRAGTRPRSGHSVWTVRGRRASLHPSRSWRRELRRRAGLAAEHRHRRDRRALSLVYWIHQPTSGGSSGDSCPARMDRQVPPWRSRTMKITRTTAALAGIGLALSLSACSSSADTTDANAAYCEGAAKVQTRGRHDGGPDQGRQLRRAGEGPVGRGPGRHRGELGSALPADRSRSQEDIAAAYDTFTQAVAGDPRRYSAGRGGPAVRGGDRWLTPTSSVKTEVGCT